MSSDESNKTSHVTNDGYRNDDVNENDGDDDDGMDSLSTESNRSIISSEYGTSIDFNQITSTSYSLKDDQKSIENNSLNKERLEDLKDLPKELIEMVQKALEELDSKENEEKEEREDTK